MPHPLLARLRSPDAVARARACREAGDDPSASLLAESVIARLDDHSRAVRRAAADALVRIATTDPAVAELLLRGVRSETTTPRWALLDVARRLGPPDPGWLPAIVEAMAEASNDGRWMAARLLVDLAHRNPETRGVAGGLVQSDERARVRRMAVLCVGQIDPGSRETAALLEQAKHDPDAEVRRAAALALAGDAGQNTSASSE